MTEQWSIIPDWPNYEASNLGRIRSIPHVTMRGSLPMRRRGQILKPTPRSDGRMVVSLHRDGRQKVRFVHQLVLEAFIGPCPEDMECLHANDIKADNRLSNLRWGTRSENMQDCLRNGNNKEARKACCKRGHPLSGPESDVRITATGGKQCLVCLRAGQPERDRRWYENHQAELAEKRKNPEHRAKQREYQRAYRAQKKNR